LRQTARRWRNERREPQAAALTHARTTLVLCAFAALLEGFDNQSMGVAAPRLALEFAFSPGQKGLVFSAATLGLFVGAACGGRAADLFGRKRTLSTSLLLFGLFSLVTTMTVSSSTLILARLLTGLGLGGAMPNFIALSSEAAHPSRRLSAVTVVMAGMPFGGAMAALIALGDRWGWGWRSIFYVGGIAPILLSLVIWRVLPDFPVDLRPASQRRIDSVPTVLFGADRASTTLLLWTGFFFTQLVLLLMLNWLPSLMVGLGFTRTQASWASVCFNISGALGASVLGRLHAGARRRMWVVLTYAGMVLALAAIAASGHDFSLAALACGLAGVFIVGAQLILFALAPLYYHGAIRCTGVGAAVAIGRFGSVVGPLYASALLAGGGSSSVVLIGILPFVAMGGAAALGLTWRRQCAD
jgi:AAHS family 3-hydroxyphenylpropionic acid transporter